MSKLEREYRGILIPTVLLKAVAGEPNQGLSSLSRFFQVAVTFERED